MKVFHPSSTSASHAGVSYGLSADGAFDVPEAAAAELLHHGFTAAPRELEQLGEHAECLAALERVTKERDEALARNQDLAGQVGGANAEVAAVGGLLDKANEILASFDETEARLRNEVIDLAKKLAAAEDAFAEHIAALELDDAPASEG